MISRVLVGAAVLAGHALAWAQPLPDPTAKSSGGSEAKIPITMPKDTEVMGAEKYGNSAAPPSVSLEEPINADTYICGPGDTFELEFWGQQNFRLRIAVDLEGRVFISKVGFVAVAGKSLSSVRKAIKDKVRATYPGLQFELTLTNTRTFLVHLVDFVAHPGVYPAHPIERLSQVLGRAGGATGSRRSIEIRHRDGTTTTADLVMYELTGDTTLNPFLIDGDVVEVPAAQTVATIVGAVHRPGTYELVSTKDVAELVKLAGGLTGQAARTLPLRVVKHNERQQEVAQELPFHGTEAPNTPLRDQDQVVVPTTGELQRSVLVIGAVVGAEAVDAASSSRRLPFVEGDTVRSLIERAGGIKAVGDLRRAYIARPQGSETPKVIPIDLDALFVRRDLRADVAVAMGDTIVVPPMQYSVMVEGAVARAGLYPYNPLFGIQEYIAHAGGRSRTADDIDTVKVIDPNGTTTAYRTGIKPHPGDAILVPERGWTRAEIVQLVMGGAGLVLSGIAVGYAVTR